MSNSLTKLVSATFKMYLKFQPHLITFTATIGFRPPPSLIRMVIASWLASMLPYLLPVVCSQHGSQCNLFIMEVPSLPGAPFNANWKSQSLQPLSLITLAFSTAAPGLFITDSRQQERACAVAFVLPLLSSWNQLPVRLQAVLPLLSLHGHPAVPRLPLHSESPSPSSVFLHNTCWHLRHPYMSHFWRMLSFMEFGAFCV